jgi:hypothetical protein
MNTKKEVSPLYLGVAATAVVALLVFVGYRTLSGPSYPEIPSMKQAYQSIDDMARKSQGDFSKLTAQQQLDLNSFARGHGAQYLSSRYKVLTSGANK